MGANVGSPRPPTESGESDEPKLKPGRNAFENNFGDPRR